MKVNSSSALIAGRKVLASNGNSWGRVHESGERRQDGVIVVPKQRGDTVQRSDKRKS
jgi:hypothetical protein